MDQCSCNSDRNDFDSSFYGLVSPSLLACKYRLWAGTLIFGVLDPCKHSLDLTNLFLSHGWMQLHWRHRCLPILYPLPPHHSPLGHSFLPMLRLYLQPISGTASKHLWPSCYVPDIQSISKTHASSKFTDFKVDLTGSS